MAVWVCRALGHLIFGKQKALTGIPEKARV